MAPSVARASETRLDAPRPCVRAAMAARSALPKSLLARGARSSAVAAAAPRPAGPRPAVPRRAATTGSSRVAMDPAVASAVREIHESTLRLSLFTTGGGAQAASWLLSVPGASRTVLETRVPYAPASLRTLLAVERQPAPTSSASSEAAAGLARAAYRSAVRASVPGQLVVGVGAACALATDRRRRGTDRAHVAVFDGLDTALTSVVFHGGARERPRDEQDDVTARLIIEAIRSYRVSGAGKATSPDAGRGAGGAFGADPDGSEDFTAELSSSVLRGLLEDGDVLERSVVRAGNDVSAHAAGASASLGPASASPSSTQTRPLECALDLLLSGHATSVEISSGAVYVDAPRPGAVYLPGSFNPLHEGHQGLLAEAAKALQQHRRGESPAVEGDASALPAPSFGEQSAASTPSFPPHVSVGAAFARAAPSPAAAPPPPAYFELSVANADKGAVDRDELLKRIAQFTTKDAPLVLTREPLFARKAAALRTSSAGQGVPGPAFAVGYDTAVRLIDPKYYGGKADNVLIEMTKLASRGTVFVVAGRKDPTSGAFLTLEDAAVPEGIRALEMFLQVPEDSFRNDISSTELRKRGLGLK